MKLIIKQYLSSLKERGELDVILPDLLSQLGLTVFSRPGRGTRQNGVDVGAVGSLEGGPETVYLFTIKPGDVTRAAWNDGAQAVRPSLDEILDAYIPNNLPTEHRDKDIVICLCCGGDLQEQVRGQWEGYRSQRTGGRLFFQEWNGDKLAHYIQASFLREDLLPEHARSSLRKSLAMLDEPDASYRHFADLIRSLAAVDSLDDARSVTAIRQMSICLWILISWAREAGNTEAAYRAGEFTLLHAWGIVRLHAGEATKATLAAESAFFAIFSAYQSICSEFLRVNVLPYADKLHAVSVAVRGSCSLDINLALFEVLGRLGVDGIWAYWGAMRCQEDEADAKRRCLNEVRTYADAIQSLINSNPALLLPAKDDHAIDICIAASLLMMVDGNRSFVKSWLAEMFSRARFSYVTNGRYPCVLSTYSELLEHPKSSDAEYREIATSASILYPVIALWSALLEDGATFRGLAQMQQELLQHCTFQLWYPDERSEEHFYVNSDSHGAALASISLSRSEGEFLSQVFGECEQTKHFEDLSAVRFGYWPLIIVACRHYRLPMPLHLLVGLRGKPSEEAEPAAN